MKKNSLLKWDNTIFRVLDIREEKALIIDCTQKSMPKWVDKSTLSDVICTEEELQQETNSILPNIDSLSDKSKRYIHERYIQLATP